MRRIQTAIFSACVVLAFAGAIAAATLVDLNSASSKDLEALKGVGKATAAKIIAARPYRSVDELSKAGLSAKQIAEIKPQVTVSAAAAPAPRAERTPAPVAKAERAPTKATAAAAGPIDLNTASQKELESLKGVGAATAKKIIASRRYASVDELTKAGVSARVIGEIRPMVTVSAAPAPAAARTMTPRPVPVPVAQAKVAPAPAPVPVAQAKVAPAPAPVPVPVAPAKVAPASGNVHASSVKLAPGERVNINTASKEKLDELPGIGPVKAQAIIDGRPYATIEDVMKVKGIKQGEFAKIRDLIVVR